MAHPRGQALIEAALMLPIILMLLVGGFWVYRAFGVRDDLARAAYEGAAAGADFPGLGIGLLERRRCPEALAAATEVYQGTLTAKSCRRVGNTIEVTLVDDLAISIPFVNASHWTISVAERAEIRKL